MKTKWKPTVARAALSASAGVNGILDPGKKCVRYRITVVDDHPLTRAGIVQLINQEPDLEVCGEAGSASGAMAALEENEPDLLITDMTMPGRSGLEFLRDIVAIYPNLPILVLSMHDESIYAERVLRSGAKGYIMKEVGGEKLLDAIRRVLAGNVYVSAHVSANILDQISSGKPRASHAPVARLSDREFEVFQLIGSGNGTREIARQLHLSPKTIDVHRARIKEKLKLQDSTALIRYAVRWMETSAQTQRADSCSNTKAT